MRVCFVFAFVIGSLLYRTQAEQLCLSCTDAVEPKDCGEFTKCGIHEKCYVEAFVNSIGSIRYNLGCRDVMQCNSGIPPLSGKRSITNLLVCSECCSGDVCNNAGCGIKGYVSRDQRGPLCASCQSQQYDDDCNKIKQCGRDEICSLRQMLNPATHEIRFQTQCEERKACLDDVEQLQEILKITGRKRDTFDVVENNGCIIRCCDGDLCNVNCSNVTTHQVQTKPSLNPLVTASSSLQTSTPLVIIPTHQSSSTVVVGQTTATRSSTHAKTTVKLSHTSPLTPPLTSTRRPVFTTAPTPPSVLTTKKIDLCFSNPCIGGACAMRNATYVCLCYPGFSGRNCETYISATTAPTTTVTDFCTPSPCFAGNCSLYLTTYRCTCNYGYTGRNCSINYIALMPQSTKQSHSVSASASTATTTSSTKRSTTSSTRASTSSTQTSTSLTTTNGVDHCLSNPCMAGRCSVLNNSFKCTCYPGYSGTQCSQVVATSFSSTTTYTKRSSTLTTKASTQAQTTAIVRDPCMSNPCMAGLCSMYYTTYRCECFYGYWGSQCEKRWAAVDTDVCSLQSCVHGICTELNKTAFHCNCEKGYTGKTCNDSLTLTTAAYVDICDLNPCGKGNCTRIDNKTFKCSCPLGYTGRTCSIKQECPSLKIGDHVVRGPDWKWGSQGISRIGTVVSIPRKGWAMVSWAEKEANYYRNGAENACDVWLYNATTASSLVTTNSSCDAHKKLCQAHCSPYGYMMDADVCDFCLCNHANHGV